MKYLLLSLVLFSTVDSFAGVNLTCNSDAALGSASIFVVGDLELNCMDKQGNEYEVGLWGFGPGLEFTIMNKAVVSCPFASKKRILGGKPLNLLGARASAAVGGGVQLGLGINQRGAICTLVGVDIGVGASAQLGIFTINKKL